MEKVRGPLIVAGDCNPVESWNAAGEVVMLATHVAQVPVGAKDVRGPGVACVGGIADGAR
jgi:hypothetical protein